MTEMAATRPSGRLVRPYAMTGGRTGADSNIALEALVTATQLGLGVADRFRWESAEILRLANGVAIIELSAALEIPIGVVRVLVNDLHELGVVEITEPPTEMEGGEGRVELLEKVLDGIRSL